MKKKKLIIYSLLIGMLTLNSCEKFLSEKPEMNMLVPVKLKDLWSLLDHSRYMNMSPSVFNIVSDDYYLYPDDWRSLPLLSDRNLYIWDRDVFKEEGRDDSWRDSYVQVNYANIVLQSIADNHNTTDPKVQDIMGAALFFRSKAFFEVAQLWSEAYDRDSAAEKLGIPIRLSPDFNEVSVRSSLEETYRCVIDDLIRSTDLLGADLPLHPNRPSKCAAWAMLARVYIAMGEVDLAGKAALKALDIKDELLNYNDLDPTSRLPFRRFNEEVIFSSYQQFATPIGRSRVDTVLYAMYDTADIRKEIFFMSLPDGGYRFKGDYNEHNSWLFNGLSTAELYLIAAEYFQYIGDLIRAAEYLNHLLEKRYQSGSYSPLTGQEENISLRIRQERRKELVFRGIRWSDVKRYNKAGAEIQIQRLIDDKVYQLVPNDSRFALSIPESVIALTGMPQN